MYENELAVIVVYFSDFFDKMTLQELVAFDVAVAEIRYWFEKCELNTTPLETFLSSKFRSEEYLSMRIFAGHEHHKILNEEERSNKLLALISDISSDNWNDWKRKICRVASMYPDLGYGEFDTFEEFLEILTTNKPELAIDLLRHHVADLSWFSKILIPPLYHSVFQEEVIALLQNYIESEKEIEANNGEHAFDDDFRRVEPALILTAVKHHLQGADAERQAEKAKPRKGHIAADRRLAHQR